MPIVLKLFMIVGGVFTIVCAYRDYEWFMNHPKASPLVALFGRTATRIFYIVLGAAMIFMGLMSSFRA